MIRILTLIAVFSLPFVQAMTFDVTFPLKIYEVAVFLAGLLLLFRFLMIKKIHIAPGTIRELQILIAFCGLVSLLLMLRILFPAEGMDVAGLEVRYGAVGDGLSKLLYLFLVTFGFMLFSYYTSVDQKGVLNAWLAGALVSSLYTWYLFIVSNIGLNPLLLPGLELPPRAFFGSISVIRVGTFREMNFMGLYILVSTAVALYSRKFKTALFLSLTMIITFSTINLLGLMLFWGLVLWNRLSLLNFSKKVHYIILCGIILLFAGWNLRNTEYVKYVLFEKIFANISVSSDAASRMDRLNLALRGLEMFKDNMFIGVGLAQYGYYYDHYRHLSIFSLPRYDKPTPNNIYIELLSEQGIFGFLLFTLFLLRVYRRAQTLSLKPLKYGFIAMLFVFLAYPTFTIMFLWAFLGLIAGASASAKPPQGQIMFPSRFALQVRTRGSV